ncbi:hypothetical protein MC885_011183 [Smutsia gigantea]|nr:hypothetical protein MC885_011183 [Smutsia gigantea]
MPQNSGAGLLKPCSGPIGTGLRRRRVAAAVMEGTSGGFRKELVSKLLHLHFEDAKTRVSGDALQLVAELLKIFVVEAAIRGIRQAQAEDLTRVDVDQLEKVLPQLKFTPLLQPPAQVTATPHVRIVSWGLWLRGKEFCVLSLSSSPEGQAGSQQMLCPAADGWTQVGGNGWGLVWGKHWYHARCPSRWPISYKRSCAACHPNIKAGV